MTDYTVRPGDRILTTGPVALSIGAVPAPAPAPVPPVPAPTYKFQDEFAGTTLDPSKWNHPSLFHCCPSPVNGVSPVDYDGPVSVSNGLLHLQAKRDANGRWHVPIVDTKGKFTVLDGYVEGRMKVPKGKGGWGAFWLYDQAPGWYNETDIMEVYTNALLAGADVKALHTTMHGLSGAQEGHVTGTVDLSLDFHVYGVDTRRDAVRFYLDNRLIWTYAGPLIPTHPIPIILNLGIGGPHGLPDATTPNPLGMDVDWIRVRA